MTLTTDVGVEACCDPRRGWPGPRAVCNGTAWLGMVWLHELAWKRCFQPTPRTRHLRPDRTFWDEVLNLCNTKPRPGAHP